MSKTVRCGLIQTKLPPLRMAMLAKNLRLIEEPGRKRVQILCLQELFYGPYFCAEQNQRWYELTECVPDGPTIRRMMKLAKKHRMVMIVPIYEEEIAGYYFNTAAVIDADGRYLGKYRKHHIPHCHPGFWEKFYSSRGIWAIPFLKHGTQKSASTFVTIITFPKVRGFWDCRALRLFSTPRPPWPGYQSICGSWNSPRTPWPTDISWAR